jgi:hypothetical protein
VTEHARDQHDGRQLEDASREPEPEAGGSEELDEVGRESFPASDPPASWAGPPEDPQDAGSHK